MIYIHISHTSSILCVDSKRNICRLQIRVLDMVPLRWIWPASIPWRATSTALELSCWSFWQDVSHLTGMPTITSCLVPAMLQPVVNGAFDDSVFWWPDLTMFHNIIAALGPGQSNHLSGGQLPSCMTSTPWTGWSIQHSRAFTLPNLSPVSLMLSHFVSRYELESLDTTRWVHVWTN